MTDTDTSRSDGRAYAAYIILSFYRAASRDIATFVSHSRFGTIVVCWTRFVTAESSRDDEE